MKQGVTRVQRISHRLTRRELGVVFTGAAFGTLQPAAAQVESTPWSVAIVPDPQWLAGSSCMLYDRLIQWAIDNRNTVIDGTPLNLKGFIQVGDCQNHALAATADRQELVAVNAWSKPTAANLFVAWCCGNHDYENGGLTIDRRLIGHAWRADTNGAWSPANLASKYGSGIDLGRGDVAFWGGVYNDPEFPLSSANNHIRIQVGLRKILIIALEFYARSAVLNWAKALHDSWPDHEVWVTTHGYMDTFGNQCGRAGWGPAYYKMANAPASNTGQEMWAGSDAFWSGLTRWPRLSLLTCGHWIDGYSQGWAWQQRQDRGLAGQTTLQVFCNAQNADLANACSAGRPDGISDVAHLMLLRVWPTSCEAYMVSTNSGLWTGGPGVRTSRTPIRLFSAPFPSLAPVRPSTAVVGGISSSATGQPVIAAGSWVSIYGTNLSATNRQWQISDFIGTSLPTVLDNVSVKFNGRSAAVYYVSPRQLNVQAPDDIPVGPVSVEVTTPYGSATGIVNVQTYAPGFFTFQNNYAAAVHADGVYVAPAGYFGNITASRPARPGQTLLVYGTGFGPTAPDVRPGQIVTRPASLGPSSHLLVYIGGVRADVQFAGLVAPGQYQFNIVVPNLPDGDQPIIAEINGFRTQSGLLICISR